MFYLHDCRTGEYVRKTDSYHDAQASARECWYIRVEFALGTDITDLILLYT